MVKRIVKQISRLTAKDRMGKDLSCGTIIIELGVNKNDEEVNIEIDRDENVIESEDKVEELLRNEKLVEDSTSEVEQK